MRETSDWQLASLPSASRYWRATPRARALLRRRRAVNHEAGVGPAHQPIRCAGQFGPELCVVPGQAGVEVLELIVPGEADAGRHRLQAFEISGAEKAAQA